MFFSLPVVLLLSAANPAPGELLDRIVAVINDDVITQSELETASKPYLAHNNTEAKRKALYRDVLDQLIAERLIGHQIKEAKITVTEPEIDRAIQDVLRQNKMTQANLEQAIAARSMSLGQYREDLKTQLIRLKIIDMKVRSKVSVPEDRIKSEYLRRTQQQEPEELVSIHHIFLRWSEPPTPEERTRVLEQARVVRTRVMAGEKFEEVAKKLSDGPTASNGGDLGEISRKSLLPELARGLKSTKAGEITEPIETGSGVHVVRLNHIRLTQATPYEALRDEIYQSLYQKEVERQMQLWVEQLKKASAIKLRI